MDDVIEFRRGMPPRWMTVGLSVFLAAAVWMVRSADHLSPHRGAEVDDHVVGWVVLIAFGSGACVLAWWASTRNTVAVRIDAAGVRESTRLAPARFVSWTDIRRAEVVRLSAGLARGPRVVSLERRDRRPLVFGNALSDPDACAEAINAELVRRAASGATVVEPN